MNSFTDHLSEIYWPTIQVLWPALLAAAALAIAGGTAGVLVILRRQTLLALSLPQIVTLGAAIGLRMGWPTLPAAAGCLLIVLLLIARASRRQTTHILLPAIYIAGVCLPILVVANAGAELIHVQNLFVGIDVAVDAADAMVATGILLAAATLLATLWRRWLLLAQAPVAAELARLRPHRWDAMFLILLALILVIGTDTLGTAMAIIMLFLPAATVLPWSGRIPDAIVKSIIAGLLFLACGFVCSIELEWPLSQSIGGVGVALFLISHVLGYQKSH